MLDFDVNYWSVFVATVAGFLIGWGWYMTFQRPWMQSMNMNPDDAALKAKMQKDGGSAMAKSLVFSLVSVFVLAGFLVTLAPATLVGALTVAFWIWLGFVLPVVANDYFYGGRKAAVLWTNGGYQLLLVLVQTLILFTWK